MANRDRSRAGYDLVDAADVIGGFGSAQAAMDARGTLTAASDSSPRRHVGRHHETELRRAPGPAGL